MSPIIFILAFNPIIQHIQQKRDLGYDLNGEKVITFPYADDFCIITTNKARHQKLINDIQENTESMGLKLKPSKCRSFSIQKGQPTVTYYKIGENVVPSVQEEEQKFLGKLVFFKGKPSETYEHIKSEIETKMNYVSKTKIRDEFKLWIYKNYITSSIRFILTIHE